MNRPQFFNRTPDGFTDFPAVLPVTVGQNANGSIPAGEYLRDFVVLCDNDTDQIFRSLFIEGTQQGINSQLQMQVRDAYGVYRTDGFVPLWLYALGAGSTPPDGGSGRAKVWEPELYCPKGSALLLDFYNPGGVATLPAFSKPSLMSVTHTAVQMEGHAVGGQGQGANVFQSGGALYQVLQFVGSPFPGGVGSINVYKSLDNGATWTLLDGAHSPTKNAIAPEPMAGCFYDGASTITVAACLGSVAEASTQPIYFQDFNLLTGTWGAAYGTVGSPNVYQINQLYKRSDGSLLVITVDSLPAGNLTAHVYSGGAWTGNFSLASLFPGGWTGNASSSTAYDPLTGTIHMFAIAFTSGPTVKHQFYQQILLSNAIGGFQDTTALYSAATAMGNPIIVNGTLMWGVMDVAITFGTILVGSPLSAPVFSVAASPGVNPSQPIPYGSNPNTLQPTLGTDGTNLWAVVVDNRNGAGPGRVWISFTLAATPLTGWVGGVIYDDATATLPLSGTFQYPTISLNGNSVYVTIQNSTGQPTNYFLLGTFSESSAAYPPYMEFRGIKRYVGVCV